jgi:YHS domain-containing protein
MEERRGFWEKNFWRIVFGKGGYYFCSKKIYIDFDTRMQIIR